MGLAKDRIDPHDIDPYYVGSGIDMGDDDDEADAEDTEVNDDDDHIDDNCDDHDHDEPVVGSIQ